MITKDGITRPELGSHYRLCGFLTPKGYVSKEVRTINDLIDLAVWHLEECEKNNYMETEIHFDLHMKEVVGFFETVEK